MKRDEAMIVRLQDTVNDMINPWSTDQPDGVVSLSSGIVATKEVQADLDRAYTLGVAQAEGFMASRLQDKLEPFHALLKRNSLKTFVAHKKGKSKITQQTTLKADRATFARLVVIAQSRQINMKEVLSYPLSSVAAALATCDGQSIAKTSKSELLKLLGEKTSTVSAVTIAESQQATLIIDAMAAIQAFPPAKVPSTFGEFAESATHTPTHREAILCMSY